MMSTDQGKHVLLVLLDLSVAFDAVDYNVLFSKLKDMFCLSGKVVEWFRAYLEQRSQRVSVHGILSDNSVFVICLKAFLTQESLVTLVHAFVTSRIDYCNSLLYAISDYNINRLQRIQNSAARVVTNTRKYDHITPILQKLHWLPVR